jgi:signal transduction histidine kinase
VKPTGGESSTGLGLSICYKIMQAHAGKIEMRNLPEGGAEFRITFPIAQ